MISDAWKLVSASLSPAIFWLLPWRSMAFLSFAPRFQVPSASVLRKRTTGGATFYSLFCSITAPLHGKDSDRNDEGTSVTSQIYSTDTPRRIFRKKKKRFTCSDKTVFFSDLGGRIRSTGSDFSYSSVVSAGSSASTMADTARRIRRRILGWATMGKTWL